MASTALDREAVDQAVARGSELLKAGRFDEAQKAFRSALMIDSDNQRILALLGLTLFKAGAFPQARPIYEELVERAPNDPSHRLNLGLVYLKLGDSDKAIGALESSRALDPSQGRAVSYLGLAYARAGRYVEAYRAFLLAGQTELATEIEVNLTDAERASIRGELERSEPRTAPPRPPPPSQEIPIISAPAIVIDRRPAEDGDAAPASPGDPQPSSVEIQIDVSTAGHPIPPVADPATSEIRAPERSDSLRFVLPKADAVPTPAQGQSMISRAVEVASPSGSLAKGVRVGSGSVGAIPLSQLATEQLVRPEDGAEMFEVTSAGALVIRVSERLLTRLDGVHVTGGELEYEPATRRSRGSQTEEKFDFGGSRMHTVYGEGYLIAVPGDRKFTAVTLDDDILYLREDIVYAFDASLRWENGNVPGLRGKLPVVQFRGDGAVALRTKDALVRVKLPASGIVYVDASRLAGWIGRVIPRAVVPPTDGPMGEICVECTGEGVVLIDPSASLPPPPAEVAKDAPRARSPSAAAPPPPPQPGGDASGPIELDVVKNANWLADDDEATSTGETAASPAADADASSTTGDAGRDEL